MSKAVGIDDVEPDESKDEKRAFDEAARTLFTVYFIRLLTTADKDARRIMQLAAFAYIDACFAVDQESSEVDNPGADELATLARAFIWQYSHWAKQTKSELLGEFPLHVKDLVRVLDQICEASPERVRGWGHHEIAWPTLWTLNGRMKSKFERIASNIGLGEECVVDAGQKARYSLETPLNQFVYRLTQHHQFQHDGECFWGFPKEELPPLTPDTIDEWLDEIIMPVLDQNVDDLSTVPEFKDIAQREDCAKPYRLRSAVRRRLKDALKAMAKK